MELPGRESVASGANAIDFVQLYRAEKRRARGLASASARLGTSTTTTNNNNNNNNAASNTQRNHVVSSQLLPLSFPPWNYPELLIPSSHTRKKTHNISSVPRLDRTRDCLSKTGIYYQPDFLAKHLDYQSALWDWLLQLPVNNNNHNNHPQQCPEQAALGKWTVLPHARRRVALFDATAASAFPPPLQWLVDVLVHDAHVFPLQEPPNHILINHYTTCDQGILPHTDGPAYHDRTATISLGGRSGSAVLLNFVPNNHNNHPSSDADTTPPPPIQILLHGGGSLIVFEGAAYSHYRHGIAELPRGAAVEHASEHCRNAPVGTAVVRADERISITVRRRRLTTD